MAETTGCPKPNFMKIGGSPCGALFADEDHGYRLSLWRIWNNSLDAILFIGLNPSTANDTKDDPTIIRLAHFAKDWGYGGLYAGNLYSIVSASPHILLSGAAKGHLTENDEAIRQMMRLTTARLVGWGEFGTKLASRPTEVLALLGGLVFCLKINKSGEPCHPLYLPSDSKLIPYVRKEAPHG